MKNRLLFALIFSLFFAGLTAQTVPTPDHVVVVVMENHGYSEIIGSGTGAPYINSLAADSFAALFTNSLAITHPSQPNYMYLFSGSSQGVLGDLTLASFQLPLTTPNLGAELLAAGKTFKGFSEDLPSVGYTGDTYNNYARKHAPWVNWQGTSTNGISSSLAQPFDSFPSNFNNLPTLCWVIPNLNDDMHNGTITQGDTWLQTHLNAYIQWAKTHNSLLILTYDEDENSIGNSTPITTIFIGQMVKMGQYNEQIDHNRVLRTMEDMYGLAHAGSSSTPAPITDCWVYKPVSGFAANPLSICPGQNITLADSSKNAPMGWSWSFPGGSPSTASGSVPPAVTYNAPGTYNITLVTNNHMGYDTIVKTAYVTVTANPSITVTDSLTVCQGSNATLTAHGAISYTWLPASGIVSTNNNTLVAAPGANTIYYVTGTTNGCKGDTAMARVFVDSMVTPLISISANPSVSVCAGTTVMYTATAINGGSTPVYQWQVDGANVGNSTSSFSTIAISNFAINCILTSNATCKTSPTVNSNVLNVVVHAAQVSAVNAAICAGNSYSFNGRYLTGAGTYNDTLSGVGGCDSVIRLTLSVNPLPVVSWNTGSDSVFVNSGAVTLSGGNPAGGVYSGPGVTGNTFYPDSVGPGTYTLSYSYTDGSGCGNSVNKTFVVMVTGLSEIDKPAALVIYPNPVKNHVFVNAPGFNLTAAQVSVFDITGRHVDVPVAKQAEGFLLNTQLLSDGVYWLAITIQNTQFTGNFIKGE